MIAVFRCMVALAMLALAPQAWAQATLYEHEGFNGRSFTTYQDVPNLDHHGFNDRASSIDVIGERWEVCQAMRFRPACVVLRPGRYASLAAMGLNDGVSSLRPIGRDVRIDDSRYAPLPGPAPRPGAVAQVIFYENENFQGRSFTTGQPIANFERFGFNDRGSSVEVIGERWEVCEDTRFSGRCVVLRPGRYASLAAMGLNNRASSVRVATGIVPPAPVPAPVVAQAIFYENENFQGRSFITGQPIDNFDRFGFNDRASSVEVIGERWEICEDTRFSGRCVVLRPGRYASLAAMGLNNRASSVRVATGIAPPAPPPAVLVSQAVFYENENFQGRSFTTGQPIANFERFGFNDRASSVEVIGERWEVCEDAFFSGRCMVLRPGRYPSLVAMGLNNRASSVRAIEASVSVDEGRYASARESRRDFRRRDNERLYEATVTSVRAVVGTPEQRCWIEQERLPQQRSGANVPGAIIGGLLGGILGHQVGGGSGKDVATVGGVVVGAAVGSNVGRSDAQQAATRDVQRCENLPSSQSSPSYWDVTYSFRGQEHRVQMSSAPGPTVTVNELGEPRG